MEEEHLPKVVVMDDVTSRKDNDKDISETIREIQEQFKGRVSDSTIILVQTNSTGKKESPKQLSKSTRSLLARLSVLTIVCASVLLCIGVLLTVFTDKVIPALILTISSGVFMLAALSLAAIVLFSNLRHRKENHHGTK